MTQSQTPGWNMVHTTVLAITMLICTLTWLRDPTPPPLVEFGVVTEPEAWFAPRLRLDWRSQSWGGKGGANAAWMKGMIAVSRVLAFPLCAQLLHSGLTLCDPTGVALCSSVRGTLRGQEYGPSPPRGSPDPRPEEPESPAPQLDSLPPSHREALSSSIGVLKCKILSKDASIFFFLIICECKSGFMLIAFTGTILAAIVLNYF